MPSGVTILSPRWARVLMDLAPRFPNIEGCGDDGCHCSRRRPCNKTVHESRGVVLIPSGTRSRSFTLVRIPKFSQKIPHGFITPPVNPTKGDISPHCQCKSSPQRCITLHANHVLKPYKCVCENPSPTRASCRSLHTCSKHLDRTDCAGCSDARYRPCH